MKKILVVGQTPPPYGGQAIMIDNMLKNNFKGVKLYHVRMAFSSDMDEVGKFKLGKVIKLLQLIVSIYYYRFRYGIHNLYYPPAPPHKIPMLRDILILNACRWLFKNVIFHFHAAGISEMHGTLKGLMKKAYEKAFFYPEYCIRLSEHNPEDGKYLQSKKEVLIPNGLDDVATPYLSDTKAQQMPVLLNVGVLTESKGILVLLESVKILAGKGYRFRLQCMGRFESESFKHRVQNYIAANGLKPYVEFLGVLTGDQKHERFAQAHIFCFPTFFEAETFGLVALEAMQFKLPVVATNWRGVPSIVRNNINGYTVPPHDAQAFAAKLEILLKDPVLREEMGNAGREIYEAGYTSAIHFQQLEALFSKI